MNWSINDLRSYTQRRLRHEERARTEIATQSTDKLIADLRKAPIRICYLMQECCLCGSIIALGDQYHDGRYGRRAHVACVNLGEPASAVDRARSERDAGRARSTSKDASIGSPCAGSSKPLGEIITIKDDGLIVEKPTKPPKAHGSRYSIPVVLAWFKSDEYVFTLTCKSYFAILLPDGKSRTAFNSWLSEVQNLVQTITFGPEILFKGLLWSGMAKKELPSAAAQRACLQNVWNCFPAQNTESTMVLFELLLQTKAANAKQWQGIKMGTGQGVCSSEDLQSLWIQILCAASVGAARRWEVLFKHLPVRFHVISS